MTLEPFNKKEKGSNMELSKPLYISFFEPFYKTLIKRSLISMRKQVLSEILCFLSSFYMNQSDVTFRELKIVQLC